MPTCGTRAGREETGLTDDGGEDADRRWQWIRAMHSEAGGPVKLLSPPATFPLRLCYLSIPAHLLSLGDFDPVAIVTVVTGIFDIALEPGRRRTPLVSRSTLMRISSFVRRIIGAHL